MKEFIKRINYQHFKTLLDTIFQHHSSQVRKVKQSPKKNLPNVKNPRNLKGCCDNMLGKDIQKWPRS